jgi:WhiB family redox-sensing transcriptional regulator
MVLVGTPTFDYDWDADNWRDLASCRTTHPALFFPVGTSMNALDQVESAKQVCATCKVQGACLEFALQTNQEAGIWGGTSEEERRRLRKKWLAARRAARLQAS